MDVYIYRIYIHIFGNKFKLSLHAHVCMHVCMDVCMGKPQINKVLNEICTQQLGMLRCKIYLVVFLG